MSEPMQKTVGETLIEILTEMKYIRETMNRVELQTKELNDKKANKTEFIAWEQRFVNTDKAIGKLEERLDDYVEKNNERVEDLRLSKAKFIGIAAGVGGVVSWIPQLYEKFIG